MEPKVFVGTLCAGEGDLERCLDAIGSQVGVVIEHCVISGLSEKAAHNALWDEHWKRRSNFDVFVKVDADTVLRSSTTLREICDCLASNSATELCAPLHDYMTDKLINGLHAYSSAVYFTETRDPLFCDRNVDAGNTKTVSEFGLPMSLRPAGYHCHHATPIQAFRYALHRSMKNQRDTMQDLIYAWRRDNDRIRGMGVIAVMLAPKLAKQHGSDYTDPAFNEAFKEAERRYDEYVKAINENRLDVFD